MTRDNVTYCMTAAKQFLAGVLVIVTLPIWWALLAAFLLVFGVWEFIRSIGASALDMRRWFA